MLGSSAFRLRGDEIAARGDGVALIGPGGRADTMTYAELARRAASVWRHLHRAGVMPGDPVGLLSGARGFDEPVGLVGVLASGAVAVPLDATAPPLRLEQVGRARALRALVVDQAAAALAGAFPSGAAAPRVVLDEGGNVVASPPPGSVVPRRGSATSPADCVACILHTSGSTGTPKPVPITWAGLDAFTRWAIGILDLGASDRVLRMAELLFDLSWFDHVAAFRTGAALCAMSRRDLSAGRSAADAISRLAPTVIYGVPSFFMKLDGAMPAGRTLPGSVRAIVYAGEVFPPRALQSFARRVPNAALHNWYGPTETNVCTHHPIDRSTLDGEGEIPIGQPCPYADCVLVEEGSGRVIEGPGVGELVVSGPTVLSGGPLPTRDRVERGPDGLLYFRGRIDRMVKVRGLRVEPGEVESVLRTHAAVEQAAVLPRADARLGVVLRAFVTLRADPSGAAIPDSRALRSHVAERLPPHMVPDRIEVLGAMPLGPTGKMDYGALSALA